MGSPRKLRKKFSKPTHPWQKLRIEEEKKLMKEYGFKNKKELWRLNSKLRDFKRLVKILVPRKDEQAKKEKELLLKKLQGLKLIKQDAILEDILALTLKDMCERRLQTLVCKKGMARSIGQARQFVTHDHIVVDNKKITSPSYLVNAKEEDLIRFADNSNLNNPEHPERANFAPAPEEKSQEEKPKEKKSKEEKDERKK